MNGQFHALAAVPLGKVPSVHSEQ